MSEFRADDAWEEDEEPEPLPVWRRRKCLLVGLGIVVLLAFLFTRGKTQHAQQAQKGEEPFIGVVVPYQPPKPAPAPAPIKAAEAAPEAPSAPPPMPPFRGQLPTANAPPVRPAMLSYVVPHKDDPKPEAATPADPPQAGLAFKAASLPGTKASPAIDDTYQLCRASCPACSIPRSRATCPARSYVIFRGRSTAPRPCC